MLFNSLIFPVFFIVVIIVYYRLNLRWQNRWLLLASYFFYGWWDWRFCSLLLFSTVLDYFVALALVKAKTSRHRKCLLSLSIFASLGVLGFFKYFNFFVLSAKALLEGIGFHADFFTLNIVLPVGISFYTFQTMAYTIDVYRRKQQPANDFIAFALYVSFFPQLVAGPIERANRLLPQFMCVKNFNYANARSGIPLMLFGYFKKIVIADSLAPMVQSCFQNPGVMSSMDLLLGVYAFAIQIYCDFSGYTDIARGIARFLGIDLMENFTCPYFSRNITEFWRRWHISLSTWLRDYLYIPLGGNRMGRNRTYVNLMITMLLGGLWHGGAWTFVVWGGLHGLYLALHKVIQKGTKPDVNSWGKSRLWCFGDIVGILFTFHIVCLGWVFFRAPSFDFAMDYLKGILLNGGEITLLKPVCWGMLAMILIDVGQRITEDQAWLLNLPRYWRYAFAGGIALATILIFGYQYGGTSPFIYFQF